MKKNNIPLIVIVLISVLGLGCVDEKTRVQAQDIDGDGWTDQQEINAGTDPCNKDTDGDGYWDPKDENPLDPDIPAKQTVSTPAPTHVPTTSTPVPETTSAIVSEVAENPLDPDISVTQTVSTPTPTPIPAKSTPVPETTSAIVSEVIDGDTIRLQNGERIRLLGINTPEMGQPYYEEARNRLKELIEGKTVTLEVDVEDKDQYGRLLRYIYVNDIFVNLEMVREGYANVYIISPNIRDSNEFKKAEEEAKIAGRGIWQPSKSLSKCIDILYFHWNAKGNDCYNLNDEYVTFKNTCSHSIDMMGWTVKDEANHIYIFPDFSMAGDATVTLYTGSGKDTATELYWSSSGYPCNAIWNNDGDTLYLRDVGGNLVISYGYSGFE